ncbi:MAG: Spi family protease inhibitor, partial [Bacteroidales bacterium]
MRTYLILISTVIFLTVSLHVSAEDVDVAKAQLAGKNFLSAKNIEAVSLQLAVKKVINNETLYYIFNNASKGFVVVSADDHVLPVLAYSNEVNWLAFSDTLRGNNVQGWMENYEKQILDVKTNDFPATDEISMKWQLLLSGQAAKGTTTEVPPLLTTTWDQGWPYNSMCPSDAGGP